MSNCGPSSSSLSSSLINFCKKNIGLSPGSCRGVKAELYPRTRGEFSVRRAAAQAAQVLTVCLRRRDTHGDTSMELPVRPARSLAHHCHTKSNTANDMCRHSDRARYNLRAYSEIPVKMAPVSLNNRASSIGPVLAFSRKHAFRDTPRLYESNYESLDSCSNGSNENNDSCAAIMKLESAVKSIDNLITNTDKSGKIQYDSITVLPPPSLPPPPPPPLPRTRSFKHYRARTVFPSSSQANTEPGRAASAPPISPMTGRRWLFQDR